MHLLCDHSVLSIGDTVENETDVAHPPLSEPTEYGETDIDQVHKEPSRRLENLISALKEIKKGVERELGGTEEAS